MEKIVYKFLDHIDWWGYAVITGAALLLISGALFAIKRSFKFSGRDFWLAIVLCVPLAWFSLGLYMGLLQIHRYVPYYDPLYEGFTFIAVWIILVPGGALAIAVGAAFLAGSLQSFFRDVSRARRAGLIVAAICILMNQYYFATHALTERDFGYRKGKVFAKKVPKSDPNKAIQAALSSYKEGLDPTGWANKHADVFRNYLKNGMLTEAREYLENVYNNPENVDMKWLRALTSDALVKILYKEGNLSQAIKRRAESLDSKNVAWINNAIVELWYLQNLHKTKVGDDAYSSPGSFANPINAMPSLDEIRQKLKESRMEDYSELRLEFESRIRMAERCYQGLHLDAAREEYMKALEIYAQMKRKFQTRGIEYKETANLRHFAWLLTLVGRYDEALEQFQKLMEVDEHDVRFYKESVATLKKARTMNTKPHQLTYPIHGLGKDGIDMAIHFRDEEFNRLDTPDVEDREFFKIKTI